MLANQFCEDSVNVGVVAIGRNEGKRLQRCLESVRDMRDRVVYVDSGSADDSLVIGRAGAAAVVQLDMSTPFTAARARNAGMGKLLELHPALKYVFFVDGDCEVIGGWINTASQFLEQQADVAIVWGNRREKNPDKSIYNLLCDIEWQDYPPGETKACGGDAMVRVQAFRQVNGYRPDLICGEEPEMCVRMRQAGWRIWHLDEQMTLHDAAIYHFSQWWKRMVRGGYGFAQGVALHGASPDRHAVLESRRAWIWGLGIPCVALILGFAVRWWALLVLAVYPIQLLRLALKGRRSARANWVRAGGLVLSKFPEALGQARFLLDRLRHVRSQLIEYK
jgi:GT2 family glycosyltransferase